MTQTMELARADQQEREVSFKPFLGTDMIKLSVKMVQRFFCKPTSEKQLCTDEQAMRFIMLCKSRALNPWEGDAFLVGYDTKDGPEFNLITAHQAFLKRAEAHPNYDGMESGIVLLHKDTEEIKEVEGDMMLPDCVLIGGWARVHRNDRKIVCYRRISLEAYQKPYGVWKSNSAGMIVKCAEADALRSSFPNSLAGMYAEVETPEVVNEVKPLTPAARRLAHVTAAPVDAEVTAVEHPKPTHTSAAPKQSGRPAAKKEPAPVDTTPTDIDDDTARNNMLNAADAFIEEMPIEKRMGWILTNKGLDANLVNEAMAMAKVKSLADELPETDVAAVAKNLKYALLQKHAAKK